MKITEPHFKKCVWCHCTLNELNREPGCKQYCRKCAHEFRTKNYPKG